MKITIYIFNILFVIAGITSLKAQSKSRVEQDTLYSNALRIKKSFHIYLPAGYYESDKHYPVVYFLHPKGFDWFIPDTSGGNTKTLKYIADSLISTGQIGKMIIVEPDLGACDMSIPGMPNMLRPNLTSKNGIGTGQFDNYFINDLIPYIDSNYRTLSDRAHRGVDGYGLGGYAAVLSALKHPEFFRSVGSFDAPFMWYNLNNPLRQGNMDDSLWLSSKDDSIFGPTFNVPPNINYMLQNDVCNILNEANDSTIKTIKSISFFIQASDPLDLDPYEIAHSGGVPGRNYFFITMLASRNIPNGFANVFLHQDTVGNLRLALLHASQSLIKHWESFQEITTSVTKKSTVPKNVYLWQNYPNPFNPTTKIKYSLNNASQVKIDVFNILGQSVTILTDGKQSAGIHNVVFNAGNLPSGFYLYRFQAGKFTQTKKMMLLK